MVRATLTRIPRACARNPTSPQRGEVKAASAAPLFRIVKPADRAPAMKPPPFVYHDPTTVAEAVDLLSRLDNALPLAGGQSLMPMLNFRVAAPDHLVDLNRIAALAGIEIAGGVGCFGAMTRQRDLEFSPHVA